jgi:hypothetical protein
MTDVRNMQALPDIIKHQEVHFRNIVWNTIGPYSMQEIFTSISIKKCSNS